MNDERAMILKMLQENKISVEEANALLDVLNEPEPPEEGGFAKAEEDPPTSGRPAAGERQSAGATGASDPGGSAGSPGAGTRSGDRSAGRSEEDEADLRFDLDLSGLKEGLRVTMGTVRDAMKGVSESLKDAFAGADFDLAGEFARAMGKVRVDDERELSAEAGPIGTLRVANRWGDVRVTGVDSERITGTARATCWGADEGAASERLRETRVGLERDGDGWTLVTEPGSERGTRIDVELRVPRAFDVSVSTVSGDLWIEELTGSQSVKTTSGDINVASLGGAADDRQIVSTKSGDVIAAALTGDVSLSTLSGDVAVNGFAGFLRVTSKSGDIRVVDGRGSVELTTLSGDVLARLQELGDAPLKIASVSGDVSLVVPADASLELEAGSTSGDVRVSLDLEDAVRTDRRVSGRTGVGGPPAEVTSVSGDILVEPDRR